MDPMRLVQQVLQLYMANVVVVNSSCNRETRRSTSVIRVVVEYVKVHVSRRLKEELSLAIDKRLWLIINTMLLKTVIPLRI